MKKTLNLLCFLFLLSSTQANAKHLVGGTISYKIVSHGANSNRYAFTMYLYRDCNSVNGAPFDGIAAIGIFNGNTQLVSGMTVPLLSVALKK